MLAHIRELDINSAKMEKKPDSFFTSRITFPVVSGLKVLFIFISIKCEIFINLFILLTNIFILLTNIDFSVFSPTIHCGLRSLS